MRHRGVWSRKERSLRSRLHRLMATADGLVHGSVIEMARVCGNPRCKCALKGEKHVSLYLEQTRDRKTRMKYIPKTWEGRIRRWANNYRKARDLLEGISDEGWSRLASRKE